MNNDRKPNFVESVVILLVLVLALILTFWFLLDLSETEKELNLGSYLSAPIMEPDNDLVNLTKQVDQARNQSKLTYPLYHKNEELSQCFMIGSDQLLIEIPCKEYETKK